MKINKEVTSGLVKIIPDTDAHVDAPNTSYTHLRWMIRQIEDRAVDGDKAHRWLGFVQGVLAARGVLDVIAERDRTRQFFLLSDH